MQIERKNSMKHNEILAKLSYFGLIEKGLLPIFWIDTNANLIHANNAVCDYLGYTHEELMGLTLSDIDINFTHERFAKTLRRLQKTMIVRFETQHRRKDGSLIDVEVVRNYVDEQDRKMLISYIFDISEKKAHERHIRLINELMSLSTDNLFIIDAETIKILYVNEQTALSTGYGVKELVGMPLSKVRKSVAGGKPYHEHLAELRKSGKATSYGIVIRKDGTEFNVETKVTLVKYGGLEYIVAIARDITERIAFENEIRRQKEELEEANLFLEQKVYARTKELEEHKTRLEERVEKEMEIRRRQESVIFTQQKFVDMSAMLSSIAHHWRQPLNSLGLMIQDINDVYMDNELTADYLKKFHDEALKIIYQQSATIEQFRSFYRREDCKTDFDASKTVIDFIKLIKIQLDQRNIDLTFKCRCGEYESDCLQNSKIFGCNKHTAIISGIESDLKQVVGAVIDNAGDSIARAVGEKRIDRGLINILLEPGSDVIGITVEDNGGGAAEDVMKQIFNPYFTTKKDSKAAGLGLYMSKLIIEEHFCGKLAVENKSGGFCVNIKVPLSCI